VAVYKDDTDMLNVDYYEVKWHNGVEWVEMPTGALVNFQRKWMKLETVGPYPTGLVEFNWSSRIDTGGSNHQVAESRLHYEANGPFSDWTASMNRRSWLENKHLVFPLDSRKLGDGLHRFHVVGWQVDAAGRLTNPRVLPVCSTQQENELILRIDNQVIDELGHPSDHNCGPVHTCTREPDTHILSVKVDGVPLDPCETIGTRSGVLQIDFMASDSGSHLGGYTLNAHWGLSDSHSLLDRPHSNVTVSSTGVQTGWQTGMNRGVYGIALSQPGASAPAWSGGVFRLTVPLDEAFPDPCCYQIRLYAWKRTIVGTSSPNGLKFGCASTHHNTTEYTIGVGV
jgi:hypothetical protein